MRKFLIISTLALWSTSAAAYGCGPRPHAWCGWYMRCEMWRDPGEAFNRALQWARYGRRASGPDVGVIVVWNKGHGRGHVGKITAPVDPARGIWMVKSGNDGRGVRERPRRVSNAYAYRLP